MAFKKTSKKKVAAVALPVREELTAEQRLNIQGEKLALAWRQRDAARDEVDRMQRQITGLQRELAELRAANGKSGGVP